MRASTRARKELRRSLRLSPLLLLSPGVTGNGARAGVHPCKERAAAFTAALPSPPPLSRRPWERSARAGVHPCGERAAAFTVALPSPPPLYRRYWERSTLVRASTRARKELRRSLELSPLLLRSPGVPGNGALVRASARAGRAASFIATLPSPPPVSRRPWERSTLVRASARAGKELRRPLTLSPLLILPPGVPEKERSCGHSPVRGNAGATCRSRLVRGVQQSQHLRVGR